MRRKKNFFLGVAGMGDSMALHRFGSMVVFCSFC